MANNFDLFFRRVLDDEGTSYEDVPGDNGGPTKCGITIADVARWHGVRCPPRGGKGWDDLVQKVRDLNPTIARDIYKKFYWDTVRADELPSGLDYAVVDYAVNSGTGRAIPTLSDLIGRKDRTMSDGLVAAARAYPDLKELISHYQDERRDFLERISQRPSQKKFRKGWLAREDRVRRVSLELASKVPAYDKPAPIPPKATDVPVVPPPVSTGNTAVAVMKTAGTSRSVWALLFSGIMWVLSKIQNAVDYVFGVVPEITADVEKQTGAVEAFARVLKLNWVEVTGGLALVLMGIAIWRHTRDKTELVERRAADGE